MSGADLLKHAELAIRIKAMAMSVFGADADASIDDAVTAVERGVMRLVLEREAVRLSDVERDALRALVPHLIMARPIAGSAWWPDALAALKRLAGPVMPSIFPCGCSRLKVSAGGCDLYAPDGTARPDAPDTGWHVTAAAERRQLVPLLTTETITDADIRSLRETALETRDYFTLMVCDGALGDTDQRDVARGLCASLINGAVKAAQ